MMPFPVASEEANQSPCMYCREKISVLHDIYTIATLFSLEKIAIHVFVWFPKKNILGVM